MKNVYVVRHAKSSWETLHDFDRTLNDRGKRDAPMMAQRLLDRNIAIDAFVSSPAKRARSTAGYFIEQFGRKKDEIILIPSLYHPPVSAFYEAIAGFDNAFNAVAVFSHNPGITAFVNTLTKTMVDNMPTCSIFAVAVDTNTWKNFESAPKQFLFFDYPKRL